MPWLGKNLTGGAIGGGTPSFPALNVTTGISLSNAGVVNWSSTADPTGTPDAGIKRGAAGRVQITDGSTGYGALQVVAGGATTTPAKVGGVLNVNTTAASNVSTGETDLMTYSLPANVLNANGRIVRVTVWGTTAANANNKTIKVYFGTDLAWTTAAGGFNAAGWKATVDIVRTASNAQLFGSIGIVQAAAYYAYSLAGTRTDSGAIVIKATGQSGTASNDITQTGMIVEVLN